MTNRPPLKTTKVKIQKPSEPPDKAAEHRLDYEDNLVALMDEVSMFRALQPEIRKALATKDTKKMLKETTAWAMAQMIHLAQNAQSEAVKQNALKDILDRAGWKPVERNMNLGANDMTDEELDSMLESLAKTIQERQSKPKS